MFIQCTSICGLSIYECGFGLWAIPGQCFNKLTMNFMLTDDKGESREPNKMPSILIFIL